jgi:prepilin-type N-terminal cleavage/methylation domain-containing protein
MRPKFACHRNRAARLKRGFTLIELMLVCALIGILISVAFPFFTRFGARAHGTEAQYVIGKLNTYFVNLYENNGSFATADYPNGFTSLPDPNPTSAPLGQSAAWDPTITGWLQVPFTFDGGLKMRYTYAISSDGSSMTITAEGSIPFLGPALATAQYGGNYQVIETFAGTSLSIVEIPSMGSLLNE